MTIDDIISTHDLENRWPSGLLLGAIGFRPRVRGRVEEYLERENVQDLSLKEAMDLFLPEALEPPLDEVDQFWMSIPMLRQPQFGPYLHDSALLTMTEADMSKEFKAEWAMRICRLMLYDLRGRPTNKRLRQAAKLRRGR